MTLATTNANTGLSTPLTSEVYLAQDDESEATRYEKAMGDVRALGDLSVIDYPVDENVALSDLERAALGIKDD
jgi:hypothetical protein